MNNSDQKPAEHEPTTPETPSPQPSGRLRYGWRLLRVALFSLAMLLALAGFLLGSESGSKLLLQGAQQFSQGTFSAQGLQGSLLGGFQLDQMQIRTQSLHLKAAGIQLDWQPSALLHDEIAVQKLHIGSLTVASRSSSEPSTLPASLQLPLTVRADELALGVLQINTLEDKDKELPVLRLSALSGKLDYRQNRYRATLKGSSEWGAADIQQAELGAQRPFALKAHAVLAGRVNEDIPQVSAQLDAAGSLQELQLQLLGVDARSAEQQNLLAGSAQLTLLPFAPELLKQARVNLQHIDPNAWAHAAPKADMSVVADLRPQTSAKNAALIIGGSVQVSNHAAGTLDQQKLPLQSLQTLVSWQGEQWKLQNFQLELAGAGQARGQADIRLAKGIPLADAELALEGINLKALDRRLQTTHIHGRIQAKTDASRKVSLQAALSDTLASLNASAELDTVRQQIRLSEFRLMAAQATLEGQGDMQLNGNRPFSLKAHLQNLDPSRWVNSPAGSLHGDLAVSGNLAPSLAINAQLRQLSGQYGGQALGGQADVLWKGGQRLQIPALDIRWGKNSVHASGAWGQNGDQLKLALDAPELAALNPLLTAFDIQTDGSMQADLQLSGSLQDPAGRLQIKGKQFELRHGTQDIRIGAIDSQLDLSEGQSGVLRGDMLLSRIEGALPKRDNGIAGEVDSQTIDNLHLRLNGTRKTHDIALAVQLPANRQIQMQASGGIAVGKDSDWQWNGQLQALSVSGKPGLRLQKPVALNLSAQRVQFSGLQLQSELALLTFDQFEWNKGALRSKGSISGARPVELLNLFQRQYTLSGNLIADADWDLQLADRLQGRVRIQRQSGDLRFNDPDGTGVPVPLGIRNLQAELQAGGLVAGTDGDQLRLTLNADGSRLGVWKANASSVLSRRQDGWTLSKEAPLAGSLNADVPDLEWLGPLINPGLVMKGRLQLNANLSGRLMQPQYRADMSGRDLELAFASEGLLLPNGRFDAHLDGNKLTLDQLQFSNTVKSLPKHDLFKDSDLAGQSGQFTASGEVDIGKETGTIQAQWQHFPLVQRADRWLVVSGSAGITEANQVWSLNGKVLADGAYFRLPKLPPPSLSDDVHVIRKKKAAGTANADNSAPRKGLKTRVDVSFDMGPRFVFVGRGLNTGLAGSLRLRSVDGSPLQANGTISTVKGAYEGYGQQLAIERGILNFQGPPANPGLNIRALRQGLAVEAGVEVVGTVMAPQVRLVSEPDVPDAEKLSWLVLGRSSEQLAGGDASLLMSAATAIFGGDGSRNVPRDIVQGLGFDEFSIGAASNGSASHVPGQTVAGATGMGSSSTTSSDQVVSVGKRLMPGLVLSVERGLSDASGAIKLSWQLTRRITIVGRTGTESAVDVNYTFSFN